MYINSQVFIAVVILLVYRLLQPEFEQQPTVRSGPVSFVKSPNQLPWSIGAGRGRCPARPGPVVQITDINSRQKPIRPIDPDGRRWVGRLRDQQVTA